MKKIISGCIAIIFLFSQGLEVYALSTAKLPKKVTTYVVTPIVTPFIPEKKVTPPIKQTTYVVTPIKTAVIPEKKVTPPKKYTTTISNIAALN